VKPVLDNFVGRIKGYGEHAHKRKYKLYEIIPGSNGFSEIIKGQVRALLCSAVSPFFCRQIGDSSLSLSFSLLLGVSLAVICSRKDRTKEGRRKKLQLRELRFPDARVQVSALRKRIIAPYPDSVISLECRKSSRASQPVCDDPGLRDR